MTIIRAVSELINLESFKLKAKQKNAEGSKYRMFLSRFNNGKLLEGAMVTFLKEHGFIIIVKKGKNQK